MSRPHTPGHTPCHKCTPRHIPCHSARHVTRRVTVPHLRASPHAACITSLPTSHSPVTTSCQHAQSMPRQVTRRVTVPHLRVTPAPRHNACHVTASHTRSRSLSQMHAGSASSHPSTPRASRPNPSASSRVAPHVPHLRIVPHLPHARSRAGSRPMSRSCTPPSHAPRRSPSCMRYAVPYDCPVDCPVNPRAHPPA